MRAVAAATFLLACVAIGQPAGPPVNDDFEQAEWVQTLIRMRADSSIARVSAGEYPGGAVATKYLDAQRTYEFVNLTANGTNARATMQLDEPSHGTHSGGIADALFRETGASVWWKWTSPINATMRLSTVGSAFDTTLGIYTRVPWDGITVSNQFGVKMVGRGDDIWWNDQLQSEADFVAHAGETYYIAVGGFRGAEGLITLAGRVDSWIYPPVIIDRVALPKFELDLFDVPQDSQRSRHNKFVKVTITCETPGAEIFYTTDGLMPNVLSTITQGYLPRESTKRFTVPLPMDTATFRAVAYKPGLRRSLLATSTAFQLQAIAPIFEPDGGEFEVVQEVRIFPTTDEESDPRAVIHYTLDGSEPDLTSPRYADSVVLRNMSNVTMKARVWYPSEWREDGTVVASTMLVKGMLPSNTSISKLFTVKERLPMSDVPTIYGEAEPMVLKGGNPPLEPDSYAGSANILLHIDDALAELWYAFAKSLGEVESWTLYTGNFTVSEVGVHWIHVQGRRRGYADSTPRSSRFEVLQRITVVEPNVPFLQSVRPGEYLYYTLNLTEVGTDVTVLVTKFFGSVDIFLSARQRRPNMHNHSLSATSMTVEGGDGGTRLLAMHTDKHLGLDVIAERNSTCPLCPYSTPIVVGILGRGVTSTQMLVNIKLDSSPVVRLSHLYHGVVAIGEWAYFKFYVGNRPEPTRRGLVVRLWQQPQAFVGIRTALRQRDAPSSDLSGTAYTMFGNADGYFEFTVPVTTASREPWFLGLQGLVPVYGAEAFNFTFAISPMLENDVPYPGRSLVMGERRPTESALQATTARTVDFREITEGVSVTGSVRIGRFSFFRIRILRSLRWLEVRVTEEHYSGGLRIYAQQGVPPSLISHLTQNVTTSSDVGQGREGYFYAAPAYEGKDYYIGVYGFSYDFQSDMRIPEYLFTLTATSSPRVSGLGEASHQTITTNYRFFFKFTPTEQYLYYQIQHGQANRDLHIVIRISFGALDLVVSNTEKYPTRSLEGVGWKSRYAVEGGRSVNVHTFDVGFKPGTYYVGVYPVTIEGADGAPITSADFGIAAYTDLTSFELEVSKAYRIRATTYSYRYFRFNIDKVYEKLTLVFREETSGEYMTALFMQGEKPSDTINLFRSATPDEDGNIIATHLNPEIDEYFLMVHFYKLGYSGPVLAHTYTIDIRVDDWEPDGYKELEHVKEFQAIRQQRYENVGVPRPLPWDEARPSLSWKVPSLELGRPQTAAFFGETWLYYSVYVSTFSSNLTVTARPLTPGLSFTIVVRRAEKPTLVTYIDKDDTPDANGEYTVVAPSPVTGGLYYIGIHGSVLDVREARLVILATVDPGIPVVPDVKVLINYFVAFDTAPALRYRYYKIYLPPDERDLSIQVTHLVGATDIVISNIDPWPTKYNYNASQPGWWKSEVAAGGGTEIVVHNYDRGYKSPATYYVGIFAASFTSYFVLARLDRPPPTVPIGSVFRSQVAESAFATFRFQMDGLIVSRLVFVVKLQRPLLAGLALYSKRSGVPTLLDYEGRTDVPTANGEYFLFIDQPKPDDVFYVGVFGLAIEVLERGQNYYFLGQILSNDEFVLYESSPYLADPLLVPPPGNYVPPPTESYTVLAPDVPLHSRLLNNGSMQFFRLQVTEFTSLTASAGLLAPGAAHHSYGPLIVVARRLYLPARQDPPYNSTHIDWFSTDVCSQLEAPLQSGALVQETRCHPAINASVLLSPFDNFANSSFWYIGVYAVGCRSLQACATWAGEPDTMVADTADCGCDASNVAAVPFTLLATRVPRLGLYGKLKEGLNAISLTSPYDLHKYFTFQVNGSAAVHFDAGPRENTTGSYDLFVSDSIPYPQRAQLPPESLRSEDALGNPRIGITVLKPEGALSLVKVGVHSSGSVDLEIRISLSPPYYPLVLGRSYAGLLRSDRFSLAGEKRALFILTPESHKGRRVLVRLRPTQTRCYDVMKNSTEVCTETACCGDRNPFGGFGLKIEAEGGGWNHTLDAPNVKCISVVPCSTGATNSSHCRDKCDGNTCCRHFETYRIVFEAELAPRWLISVTGTADESQRFTESFEIDIKIASATLPVSSYAAAASSTSALALDAGAEGGDAYNAGSVSDDPEGAVTPEGRYAFQSARRKGHESGVEEQPITDLQDGEAVSADSVAFGAWRIYRFAAQQPGIASVYLRQHTGSFGLRLLMQREALPTHNSFLTFETTDPGDPNVCTATTAVGARACSRCTHDFCICDAARGDVCTGKVDGSVLTEALSDDPMDGSQASIRAPIYPKEPLMIAVHGESEIFAPYSFTLQVQFSVEKYEQNTPCSNVTAGQVVEGRIRQRERILFQAPPIPEGYDAAIRLDTPFTDTWGKCQYGDNDGTACAYDGTPEVYTGLSDRPIDPTCRGCFIEEGWKYIGTPLKVRYFQTINFTYGVPGQRCFYNGEYVNHYNVTSKDTYPFYRTYTWWNTDPNAICDLKGQYPWTVPWPADEFVDAIKVDSARECCDKCAREATCNFWTVTDDDECTQCDQQDVSYQDTYVRPADTVTFIPGTGETEWYESAPTTRVRGPLCYPAKNARCCRLLAISESSMVRNKVADARVVSGSSGRCKPDTNGHVQLKVSQALTCSTSTSRKINDNMIVDTAESMAKEAYLDDRQVFYKPFESDNLPTCVQWWNGLSMLDTGLPLPDLTAPPRCVRYSSETIKLQAKDETNSDQCLVSIGRSLPAYPQMRSCMDTVFRMGNGSGVDWKYYSVDFDHAGGYGVEWTYLDSAADANATSYLRFIQKSALGSYTPSGGGCLGVASDMITLNVVDCADTPNLKALQQWVVTSSTSPGQTQGLVVSELTETCLTGLLACEPSRRAWAGDCSAPPSPLRMMPCPRVGFGAAIANLFAGDSFYRTGQPLVLELTGLLSSSFLLNFEVLRAPTVITAEKDYKGLLQVADVASSIKYRFILKSPTLQGTAGLHFYLVISQLLPVRHRLQVSYRHRQTSNLQAQRPPGWDDAPTFISHAQHGPDASGLYVVPFESAAASGPYDFDITIEGNATLAGEEVPIALRVWTAESFARDFKSVPLSLALLRGETAAQRAAAGDAGMENEAAHSALLCGALVPGKALTCGPPTESRSPGSGESSTSEGWWVVYVVSVGEPTALEVEVPGANCSARVFVQAATGGSLVNVTKILEETWDEALLSVGGAGLPTSASLLLYPTHGVRSQYIAVLFPDISPYESAGVCPNLETQCESTGWVDSWGDGCSMYDAYPAWCGYEESEAECCACGGGTRSHSCLPANTSNASYACNRTEARVTVKASPANWGEPDGSAIDNLTLGGEPLNVSAQWASQIFKRIHVEDAAYYIFSFTMFAGNAAIYLEPEGPDLPNRQRPPAAKRRLESVALGQRAAGWNDVSGFTAAFALPSLILSPDDEDFALTSWIVAIFTDAPADLSFSVTTVSVPPTLQLFQDYSLVRPVAVPFELRVPYHPLAALAVTVLYEETSGKSAQDCPLSLLARYSLPPTHQEWTAAAGREQGRRAMSIPPKGEQGVTYLFVSAARCPGGYTGNGTHCIRLSRCAQGDATDFEAGGPLHQLSDGLCAIATNVTGKVLGANATTSPAVMVPPAQDCSFRFRLETSPPPH